MSTGHGRPSREVWRLTLESFSVCMKSTHTHTRTRTHTHKRARARQGEEPRRASARAEEHAARQVHDCAEGLALPQGYNCPGSPGISAGG